MSRSGRSRVRCGLCGHEFEPVTLACHAECPLGPRCNLICCPHCGYQVVDESRSRAAGLLRRLWPGSAGPIPTAGTGRRRGAISLGHVAAGIDVEVEGLDEMPASRSARLSAFGLVPGRSVRVVQRRPVPVIRVDETEIALSDEILNQIRVVSPSREP
jgi:Fe2+ transport system protein FeoA